MKGKVYIYNLEQVYFYIQNGVKPVEKPQVHYKTGRIFFVFGYKETEEIYSKWCNKEH